jgi:anti-anti-sigma regulatory factor
MQLLEAPPATSTATPLNTDGAAEAPAGLAALAPAGELTIYAVSELRAQWLDWLAAVDAHPDMQPPALHAAAIDLVDAAGLQLLLSLDLALASRGHALRIGAPSAALSGAMQGVGLSDWLHARHTTEATA